MLEDARSDILSSIENCRRSIIKDQQKIEGYRQKLNDEPNQLRRWFYYLEIEHKANNIVSKKDDLKSLALNLELTDEALESQRRDSALIEESDHLPFSSLVGKDEDHPDKANVVLLSESERISNIANTIGTILAKATEGFFKPKKEEPARVIPSKIQETEPARMQTPKASLTPQKAVPSNGSGQQKTAVKTGSKPADSDAKTPADPDFDGDISCHLDRKC